MAGQMGWKIDHLSPRQACGAVLAALAVVACGSGPAVSPARAETFIIQGSTTFNRVIMERHASWNGTNWHSIVIARHSRCAELVCAVV